MENSFITITLSTTLTQVIIPVMVWLMDQIELFNILQEIVNIK